MIAGAYPDIEFWLDNGQQAISIKHESPNLKPVIGTESQQFPPSETNQDFILSLDFKNQQPAGLTEWFEQSQFWPETVIVMTLSRVGSNNGPDFKRLFELQHSHSDKRCVAAGGIRDRNDLIRLKNGGIRQALLATSLHSGAISSSDLQNL